MQEKQFKDLMAVLKSLDKKLDIIIALEKLSAPAPKLYPFEKQILKLCNSKNTIKDIVEKTKKTKNHIEVTLSELRNKGLIRSVTVKGKLVYAKI